MTTFKDEPATHAVLGSDRAADRDIAPAPAIAPARGATSPVGGGARLSVAEMAAAVSDGPLPFRLTAYDGSAAGPADAPVGLHVANPRAVRYLITAPGELGLSRAYVAGDLQVVGIHPADPYELLRLFRDELRLRRPPAAELARIAAAAGPGSFVPPERPAEEAPPRWQRLASGLRHSKRRDSASISKHYDVSNRFYEMVLGPSMAYTCAVYPRHDATLEAAQHAKHALVFDKLGLRPGQRLLDVGCGWGGMVRHAARNGVRALGVTLSRQQAQWAQQAIAEDGLEHLAEVRHLDYRDVTESGFDAVSSIGLTEHIGVHNYARYFTFLQGRLRPGGRLLNHCITRPSNSSKYRADAFIDRYVFPDGELTGSGRVIMAMQDVGWDVRHSENLREHYALTLRDWCGNLQEHWDECVAEVGLGRARVWGLYMAASSLSFERNDIQLHQVLAVKPDAKGGASVPLRQWWTG